MEFNIGDKVMVVRKVLSEEGYHNDWFDNGMDPYVNNGICYTISSLNDYGIRFKEDRVYGWPAGSLEFFVEDPLSTPVTRKIKQMEAKRKELGYRW